MCPASDPPGGARLTIQHAVGGFVVEEFLHRIPAQGFAESGADGGRFADGLRAMGDFGIAEGRAATANALQ